MIQIKFTMMTMAIKFTTMKAATKCTMMKVATKFIMMKMATKYTMMKMASHTTMKGTLIMKVSMINSIMIKTRIMIKLTTNRTIRNECSFL
jgi:hypothetical protein